MATTGLSHFDIKFEKLLSSPYTWKPHKHCEMWSVTWNNIKNKYGELVQNRHGKFESTKIPDEETDAFRKSIKKEKRKIWPRNTTWKNVLGTGFFDLLKKYVGKEKVEKYVTWSLMSLHRLVRNSRDHDEAGMHPELMLYEMKPVGNKRKKVFVEFKFARFWITKFPTLSPCIWNAFKSRRDQLPAFYGGNLDYSRETNIFCTPLEFVQGLKKACDDQMDAGFLEGRLKMGVHTIELRPLNANLLGRVLDGSSSSQILVKGNTVSFSWNNNQKESMPYDISSSDQGAAKIEAVTYIFTDDFKMEQSCFLDDCKLETEKVVVFLAPDSIEKIVTYCRETEKFTAYPIEWKDISFKAKQNLRISVKDIFEDDCIIYADILSKLNVKDLNTLLRNKKVDLLENFKTPEICKYYTTRQIYNRDIMSSSILSADLSNDILIIINCSGAKSFKTGKKRKIIEENDVFSLLDLKDGDCKLFLIEEDIVDFHTKIEKFEGCKFNYCNVHFLKSIGKKKLKWLHTHGKISGLKPHLPEAAKKIDLMKEEEFLSSLKSKSAKHERLLFIADEPGMGKSEILSSFSKELEKDGKIVLVLPMNKFVEHLHRKYVDSHVEAKENVVSALSELVCGNGFKSELFAELLRNENESITSNLEIMLDGLDEVKSSLTSLAFHVIKTLKSELPLARVWVTCREWLLDDVREHFGRLGHMLEPFTRDEQINFLVNMWSDSMNEKKLEIKPEIKSKMVKFAGQCIENCLSMDYKEVAGIPLQCRMIGEIFETQVLEKNFNLEPNSYTLCDIYEMFIKRKLEIYFHVKEGLSISMDKKCVEVFFETTLSNLTKLSLQLLFPETVSEYKSANEHFHTEVSEDWKDILLRHGILTETDPPILIHRTFAEYLVARFVVGIVNTHLVQYGNLHNLSKEFQRFLLHDVIDYEFIMCCGENLREGTLIKFLDMQLAKDPKKKITAWLRLQPHLNKLAKIIASESTDFIVDTSNYLLDIIVEAGNCCLGNIVKLLINFPDGQLHGLLYGIHIFCRSEAIFDHITSVLDPGPNCWHKIPSIDDSDNGLLHHLIDTISDAPRLDVVDKICSYMKKVVELDGSLLEQKNDKGRTPLLYLALQIDFTYAPNEFYWKIFRTLVELKADINAVDDSNNTVLHNECERWISLDEFMDIVKVKKVVEMGYKRANFNIFNSDRLTPLLYALSCKPDNGDLDNHEFDIGVVYDRLIEAYVHLGTDLNAIDEKGNSVLLAAIRNKKIRIPAIKSLVRHVEDVNAVNFESDTALHLLFSDRGSFEQVTNLLEHLKKLFDLMTYFVDCGFKKEHFNSFNKKGEIPLMTAFFSIKRFFDRKIVKKMTVSFQIN